MEAVMKYIVHEMKLGKQHWYTVIDYDGIEVLSTNQLSEDELMKSVVNNGAEFVNVQLEGGQLVGSGMRLNETLPFVVLQLLVDNKNAVVGYTVSRNDEYPFIILQSETKNGFISKCYNDYIALDAQEVEVYLDSLNENYPSKRINQSIRSYVEDRVFGMSGVHISTFPKGVE